MIQITTWLAVFIFIGVCVIAELVWKGFDITFELLRDILKALKCGQPDETPDCPEGHGEMEFVTKTKDKTEFNCATCGHQTVFHVNEQVAVESDGHKPTDDELDERYKGHLISSEDHRSEVESLLAEILTLKELLRTRQILIHKSLHDYTHHQYGSFEECKSATCVAVKNALEGK